MNVLIPDGHYCYVVKAKRTEGNIAAWIFLTHKDKFKTEEFEAKIAECEKFVNEVRIIKRREETARNKVPIGATVEEAAATNDTLFEQDAEFLEIMMIDRFGFKKLMWYGGEATIIPTITGFEAVGR
jgi:hypothetical protein